MTTSQLVETLTDLVETAVEDQEQDDATPSGNTSARSWPNVAVRSMCYSNVRRSLRPSPTSTTP